MTATDLFQDVRHALRLVSLGFEREAERILRDHSADPRAKVALKTVQEITPGDARLALDRMPAAA